MASFAERLKTLREERGLTQETLALEVGVARSTIGGYEAPSKQREPEFEVVNRLASYFGVTTDYLIGKSDDPRPPSDGKPSPVLPAWLSKLPPDMQRFVEEESKHGWPYLRLARGLKMQDLSKEELMVIVETWMDAKSRYEKREIKEEK